MMSDKYKNQKYSNIKSSCLKKGILWEDPEFPANNKSLFFSKVDNDIENKIVKLLELYHLNKNKKIIHCQNSSKQRENRSLEQIFTNIQYRGLAHTKCVHKHSVSWLSTYKMCSQTLPFRGLAHTKCVHKHSV
jgi:hypothetical protein